MMGLGSRIRRFAQRAISLTAVAVLLLTVFLQSESHAGEIEDVPFADSITLENARLPLAGLGLLRYRVFFRGYVGGLYLPADASPKDALADIPKALELYYFWDIEGRFFGEAADELLARTHPPARVARLRDRLDRLHALYKDVKAGDRYRLTYRPGLGTTLAHNGNELGTIPGADFAQDYFGIWLGKDPLNVAFRDQILDGNQADSTIAGN